MARNLSLSLVTAFLLLAACQPAGVTPVPTPTAAQSGASPATGQSPAPAATTGTVVSAAPSVSSQRELVLGTILGDEGQQLDDATVDVTCDLDPSLNGTLKAPGAFSFRAPVGSTVTVKASKAGFSTRTRVLKVEATEGNDRLEPNRLDFGGSDEGALYGLSEYPEIAMVSPSNLQKDVVSNPLVVKLTFSHKLSEAKRDVFNHIFQLRFQSPDGDQVISTGSRYNDTSATLEWDASGKIATFTFPVPVVAYRGEAAAVTLAFDQTTPELNWPLGDNGKRLGRALVSNATNGSGVTTTNRMAPILRDRFPTSAPTARPSPLVLWGLTHWTDISFTLAQDLTPVTISKAQGRAASGQVDDLIELTFSKPMRGFPESALDPAGLRRENYAFVLGRNDTALEANAYLASDPSKGGTTPTKVEYDPKRTDVILLHVSPGTLSKFNRFKLYVNPKVKDVFGASVKFAGQGTSKDLAENVVEGNT